MGERHEDNADSPLLFLSLFLNLETDVATKRSTVSSFAYANFIPITQRGYNDASQHHANHRGS
jgi:hypothetical protein